LSSDIKFSEGYIKQLPLLELPVILEVLVKECINLKRKLLEYCIEDRLFQPERKLYITVPALQSLLVFLEGVAETQILRKVSFNTDLATSILKRLGVPAGFHPLIAGYDALPELPAELELPELPGEVLDYLERHERISPAPAELARIKARLGQVYAAGPGAKDDGADDAANEAPDDDEDAGAVAGAHIPIPTETFLEELSVKMQLHPISVYWLLEELRSEGARCKPEERRLLEDRLSVLTLRLLGHRWPKQIEAGEPVPDWADPDGIIPLTTGSGQPTLAERLRQRLRAEDGATGAQRAEALLVELTGQGLEEWLRREFFKRHTRQFKYRPIAWHLASNPAAAGGGKGRGKGKGRSAPAFECLLYYHACAGDAMARIRTQYVEPLLRDERQRMTVARRANQETEAAQAQARIQDVSRRPILHNNRRQ
jgi:hypothetical protein